MGWKLIGMVSIASYALGYACARVPHLAYGRHRLVAVPASRLPAAMPRGYVCRELDAADLAGRSIDAPPAVQAERFAQGFTCLGLFCPKGELAGVTWLLPGHHLEPTTRLRFLLPGDAAWDTGLWIAEEKRLSRAFPALWAGVGQWLHQRGLRWTVSTIADYNAPSILSHQRLGALLLGHLAFLRVGRWQMSFGARPWLVRLGKVEPPTVHISVPG